MSLIYFMRRADGAGPIKIGCSKVPERRLQAHMIWAPEKLEIVGSVPGTFRDEKRIHRQFDLYRVHGEWFEASHDVQAFMARALATGRLPPPPADDKIVQMEEMYCGGKTLREIGEHFGVTRERVRQLLRKAGVPSLGARPQIYRKAVTPELEAKIIMLGKRGFTRPEIAKQTGLNRQSVGIYLDKHGVKVPRAKAQCRPETITTAFAVAEDYQAGLKTMEIAAKHNIAAPHIFRLLRIACVKPNRLGTAAGLPVDEVVDLYRQGQTVSAIAEKFDVRPWTVSFQIRKAGALRSREENERIRLASVCAANARRKRA